MAEQASSQAPSTAPVEQPKETTTQAAPAEAKKDDGERFKQLARLEKKIRQDRKELQKERESWEQEKGKVPAGLSREEWKSQFLQDPQALGIGYEDLSKLYMNQPTAENQQFRTMQAEIASLKQKLEKSLEQVGDGQKKAYEQAIKQLTRDVSMLVDSDEAYEMVKSTNSQDAVVELIKQTYDEDGILLTASEAGKKVEDYLLEQAVTMANLKKVQAKLAPTPSAPQGKEGGDPKQSINPAATNLTNQSTKTLTNAITQQSKAASALTPRERAILAMQTFNKA